MLKLKQASLFEDDPELQALREKQLVLEEAHRKYKSLPAKLEREKIERQATMPPMPEIEEREKLNKFEQNLSRGQIENVLRTQRHSLGMMLLLLIATGLMLYWAFKIISV
jgi:hypothetical protein